MAITSAMCTSFKVGLLEGAFDFSATTTQTFKVALYTSGASLGAQTTAYTSVGEVPTGNGYTAGGKVVSISTHPTSSGTTAYIDLEDVVWTNTSLTARGALLYLADGVGNPAIAVADFGADVQTSAANFVVQFPSGDSTHAVLRLT